MREAAGGCEPGSIFTLRSAAIDIALWGIKGNALGQPFYREPNTNLHIRRPEGGEGGASAYVPAEPAGDRPTPI